MSQSGALDPLSGLGPLLRVRPELESLCLFGAAWMSRHAAAATGWASFHLVVRGGCALEIAGAPPVVLVEGDIAILPHGDAHAVRGTARSPDTARMHQVQARHNDAITVKSNVTSGVETELICGRLRFEQAHENLIFASLPPVIVVRTGEAGDPSRLRLLMQAIREELEAARPGALAIADDLASALLVMTLRLHAEREQVDHGLFALLGIRPAARAVAAMMAAPDRDWSLDDLAERAGTSRATLVRIFRKAVGMAPLAFLADVRLNLARRKLQTGAGSLAMIAAAVGYQSESAFSRAFQRRFGLRPGEMRRGGIAL